MEKKNENSRVNVYQMVTDRIMEQLKQNIIPWHKPWVGRLMGGEAINYVSRRVPNIQTNQTAWRQRKERCESWDGRILHNG